MLIEYQQARMHLELLTGNADSVVTFQVIYDPKDGVSRPDLANNFTGQLDSNKNYFDQVSQLNCGIFVTVNGTDGNGREESNIVQYRALFADYDGVVEPDWPIQPHFTTRRDETHGHAYWLVDGIVDATQFRRLQRKIALRCGTDTQVIDPCRVLRLCGTPHLKNPADPQMYRVGVNNHLTGRYTPDQIEQGFSLGAQGEADLSAWVEQREGLQTGSGYTNEPRYIAKFHHWCETQAAPAVSGGDGTETLFRTTAWAHDHGIDFQTALPILWERYNPRCVPPWTQDEYRHFSDVVERAYKYATSAAGCKTASAVFQALGEVPEPIGGWEANRKLKPKQVTETFTVTAEKAMTTLVSSNRMNEDAARDSMASANSKTGHYILAKIFDGMTFKGCEVYRWGKVFYVFNGKHWQAMADELVKAKITAFYDGYQPSTKFVNGVYDMFSNLVTVDERENNTWFSNPDKDANSTIIFENGIVDVNGDQVVLMPHTADYFCLNQVDFDFDPNADCPGWMRFLNDLWDGDEKLKQQLQEYMGYCLTNDVARQKFALLIGKSRGGKGVIQDIIRRMVGTSRVAAPSLDTLGDNVSKNTMARSQITIVPDAHNVPIQRRDAVLSMLKAVTGCDPITYDVKYKDSRTHVLQTHVIVTTNNMPEFVDASGALVNRMLVFPFWKTWEGKENVGLRDELYTELSGITAWAIRGLKRLVVNGRFTESDASLQEKADMREDMFRLSPFIRDYCTVTGDKAAFTSDDALYFAYNCWCAGETNIKAISKRAFLSELRSSPLNVKAGRREIEEGYKRGFVGITVTKRLPANNVTQFPVVDKSANSG